jgi:hypothetical protein
MIIEVTDMILHYDNHLECTQLAITRLGKQSMILGYNWLCSHNPEIDWQTREVKMSRCPVQCVTCRIETKHEKAAQRAKASQISACWAGAFPIMTKELDDQDSDTEEEVQDKGPAFDEEGDCVFTAIVYLVNPQHFICASSMVSGHLVEASVKNSMPKGFYEIVPTALHSYEDVFSEMAFDTLPEHRKWDHAIELECESLSESLPDDADRTSRAGRILGGGSGDWMHSTAEIPHGCPGLLHQEEGW